MNNEPDSADSSLSEPMAARIEIKELGDPAHQKKITDSVEALDGVIEAKIEKGTSLTIRWQQLKRKSSRLSAPPGPRSKLRPQIRKARIQTCRHKNSVTTAGR
jgi:hypothetical protein